MSTSSANDVTTSWRQTKGPTISTTQFLTGTDLTYLVIEANTLSEGDTYRFEMNASLNFDIAVGVMEFTVNMGPRSGQFLASPTLGTELTTEFTFLADGWIDPEDTDYPLLYGYKYLDVNQNPEWMQKPLDKT